MNKVTLLIIALLTSISNITSANVDLNAVNMPFVKNVGQAPDHVAYYVNTPKASIFVDVKGNINYHFKHNDKSVVVKETMAKGKPVLSMQKHQSVQVNIIKGKDKSKWHKNVPNTSEIHFGEVWKGIDVKLVTRPGNVEKLFTLKPQANVEQIKLFLSGIEKLDIKDNGQLSIQTELGIVAFTKPIAWQNIRGERLPVEVSYISNKKSYGFKLGQYDHTQEVIIDPLLAATYVGGSGDEIMGNIHINGNNEIIVVGSTQSPDFPTTSGVISPTSDGSYDFFVLKFNPDMTQLIASTYFGGNGTDQVRHVAFDANDNIYISGSSSSTDFPIPNMPYTPYQQLEDANSSIFIAGLSADLTTSLGATYIGGGIVDMVRAIAIAPNGNVYVTGFTNSIDYPYTIDAFETSGKGIVISAFNPDLSELLYSTRVGEGGSGFALTFDSDGSVFLGANKFGINDYTTTPGVYKSTPDSALGENIYLAHFSSDLSTLITATFISIGGAGEIIITPDDELLINAKTTGFPISVNAFDTSPAITGNATIFKMDKAMTTLGSSTYIDMNNQSISLSSDGSILVFGTTATQDFPGGKSPSDPLNNNYHGGPADFAIVRFNSDLSQVINSDYIGGSSREFHAFGLSEDSLGNVIVAGRTDSNDVATTANAFDSTYGGLFDIIVLKATSDLNFGPSIDNIFCDSFESPNGNGVCN